MTCDLLLEFSDQIHIFYREHLWRFHLHEKVRVGKDLVDCFIVNLVLLVFDQNAQAFQTKLNQLVRPVDFLELTHFGSLQGT